MPYVFENWSINVRKLVSIKKCRPTFPTPPNTLTKSTQGYRCAGSREVTSLRCLVHERLTPMRMAFNYKRTNVYSYEISYQSVDANLFYSIFVRTFRSPLVLNAVAVVCSRYYSVTQSFRSSQRWPIKSKPHLKAV